MACEKEEAVKRKVIDYKILKAIDSECQGTW